MSAQPKDAAPSDREYVITREYDAPRELVWLACTQSNHVAQWWGPRGFSASACQWDAQPGNIIHVVMRGPDGMEYPMGGQFHEVNPPEKLVTTTGPLDARGHLMFEFRHTLTLQENNGKTTLTMRSRLMKVTDPDSARFINGFEAGMNQSLERLASVLDAMPFSIEQFLNAPVDRVWRAVTTPVEMSRWFFDMNHFKPEIGAEFDFTVKHEGHTYEHLCRVTALIPRQKIAYSWRYNGHKGESLVTFELFAEGTGTRFRLTHEGLETFPKTPHFERRNFVRGWTWLIGASLPDFVEKADREIFVMREFNAPRELTWEAMTNPKHVVNWWGPRGFSTTIEVMDFRVGGEWKHVMRGPDGVKYPNHSVFLEIEKPERIVFRHDGHRESGSSVDFVSTWTFEELAADKTRVSIRLIFPSAAERDRIAKEFGAIEGARQTLERMGEYMALMD